MSAGPPRPRVTVVGDTLLDVDWTGEVTRLCPDSSSPVLEHRADHARPGGAGLAACFAADGGARTRLVTALGSDREAAVLRDRLEAAGVELVDLGLGGPTPVKLRLRAGGRSLARVDRGCSPVVVPGRWGDDATAAVEGADAVLVADYGRSLAALPPFRALLAALAGRIPVVWDPHPRGAVPPQGGLDVLVPNAAEARALAGPDAAGEDDGAVAARLACRFSCAVAVTVGGDGAVLAVPGGPPRRIPTAAATGDPCGAGDRFAASLVVARARGCGAAEAVAGAVDDARRQVLGGFVGPGGSGLPLAPEPGPAGGPSDRAVDLAARVRGSGGTVVVAGGCFDVLHAGHVRLLEAARSLGDCLIVCVNGDLSVRRLKGRHRPVNPVEDRTAVLEALAPVDAVLAFEEDTPAEALTRLRPHLFVKGADHAGAGEIPEAAALRPWGGEVVYVPLVPGRSTTRILQAAATGTEG